MHDHSLIAQGEPIHEVIRGINRAVVKHRTLKVISLSHKLHKDPSPTQADTLCAAQTGHWVVLGW
jgi:hypothetical protein